jgi:F-type H+-transporting ATPase subunit c
MKGKIYSLVVAMAAFFVAASAFASEGAAPVTSGDPYKSIAAALCIAIAAFGGALGQGKAAAAALEGISRNPGAAGKIFTPFILGLALIESLVIYALVVVFAKI